MYTDRLYYQDSYLREFSATVSSCRPLEDRTEVVLDRTAFYPEGGGQPSDLGTLGGAPVLAVVERDGEVVHLVRGKAPQGEILGVVDWERRFDHMQQHSGQHLLSQAFERLLQASTVSFHMGAESSSIDLDVSSLASGQLESVERLANEVVFENRAILLHLLDPEDLSRFDLRKGTERTEQIRVVEVPGFDSIPCGGTHCRSTGEIGLIKVVRCDRRGANSRVEFLCGGRTLRDYRAKNEIVRELASGLNVRDLEVRDAVERLQRESVETRRQAGHLRDRLLDYQAGDLARDATALGRASVVVGLLADGTAEDLKHLAARLTTAPGRVVLLAATAEKAHVLFARSEDVLVDVAALLREACAPLGGRGGGRPNLAQGGIPEPARARAALDEALGRLRSLLAV